MSDLIEAIASNLEAQMEAQADDQTPSSLQRERGLVWLEGWFDLSAALAALRETHHLVPRATGDDGELVERLRKMQRAPDGTILPWVVNPDGPEAAARITALSAALDRIGNRTECHCVACNSMAYQARQALGAKP